MNNNHNNRMEEYKLVVMGAGGVGKSALVLRYVCDEFLEEYDPTIEDTYRKEATLDDLTVVLDILDTAGQEEFRSMQDEWITKGQGFILVYSIDKEKTFQDVHGFKDKVKRSKPNVPILLIGNKADLPHEQREVSLEQGQKLAKDWGCEFMETSAKESSNVIPAFEKISRLVKDEQSVKGSGSDKPKSGGRFCAVL